MNSQTDAWVEISKQPYNILIVVNSDISGFMKKKKSDVLEIHYRPLGQPSPQYKNHD